MERMLKRLVLAFLALLAGWLGLEHWRDQTGDILSAPVLRVVDGDTIVVSVEGSNRKVRLIGVDTPETVKPNTPVQYYGRAASDFTKRELTGRRVWLEYDAEPTDRYGRHLAYVWLTSPPESADEASVRRDMFNARLLTGGYARVLSIKPNTRYGELFARLEREARRAGIGLWGQEGRSTGRSGARSRH